MDGAGHSAWSEPASAVTPGERALPAPAGAAAAESSDGALPKRRRNKKPAVERELALADPKLSAFPTTLGFLLSLCSTSSSLPWNVITLCFARSMQWACCCNCWPEFTSKLCRSGTLIGQLCMHICPAMRLA